MDFFKNLYQKAVFFTVSYGELAVWVTLIVLILAFFFGGR